MAKKAKKAKRSPRGCSPSSTKLTNIGYKGARCGCVTPSGWRFRKNSLCNADVDTPKGPVTSRAGWAWLLKNLSKKGTIKVHSFRKVKARKR